MKLFKQINEIMNQGKEFVAHHAVPLNQGVEAKANKVVTLFIMIGMLFFLLMPECYAGSTSLSTLKTGFATVLNVIMGGAFIWGTVIIIMGMNGQGGGPDWAVVIKGALIAGSSAIMLVFYNVFSVAGDAVPNM